MSAPQSETYLFEDMEAVRQSGLVNMFDRHGVEEVATMLDLEDLHLHIAGMTNKDYAAWLVRYGDFLRGET